MKNVRPKSLFLYSLILSIAVSALIGIVVISFGDFGELALKVLLTAVAVTVTSILGLACGAYFETGRGKVIPTIGIVTALVSGVLWVFVLWDGTAHEAFYAKLLLSLTLGAASCSHISLLSLARLDRRFMWSRYAIHATIWLLTAYLLFLIWNVDAIDESTSRIIGVLSIIIAALTIATPAFHKLSNAQPDTADIDAEITRLKARIEELEAKKNSITRTATDVLVES